MKKLLLSFLLFISISFESLAQQNQITELINKQKELSNHIKILTDSIKSIELKISKLKSKEIKKIVTDSTLKVMVKSGAKIKNIASPLGELIIRLNEDKEVVIMDYEDGYFSVCTESVCGYMNDFWIKKDDKIEEYINVKEKEEIELRRLEREQKLKNQKDEYAKLEMNYIKKYGKETYNKLKQGYYWVGMNKKMAIISLGRPNDINRTVGSWGVHEQWVYDNLYLYFENGKLTSFQD